MSFIVHHQSPAASPLPEHISRDPSVYKMDDLDLPYPLCLGKFDEESCRYFLNNVGGTVVPLYPFSFGMGVVFEMILDKYGLDNLPDVISLLQDLLEEDQITAGLGDDGDVWRAWRHSWKHRNVDEDLDPFIPRVGRTILPQPTSRYVRLLKARNFALDPQRRPGAQQCSSPGSPQNRYSVDFPDSFYEVVECHGTTTRNAPTQAQAPRAQDGATEVTAEQDRMRTNSEALPTRNRQSYLSASSISSTISSLSSDRQGLLPRTTNRSSTANDNGIVPQNESTELTALPSYDLKTPDSDETRGGRGGPGPRSGKQENIVRRSLSVLKNKSPFRKHRSRKSCPPEFRAIEYSQTIPGLIRPRPVDAAGVGETSNIGSSHRAGHAAIIADALRFVDQETTSSQQAQTQDSSSSERFHSATNREARFIDGVIFINRRRRAQTTNHPTEETVSLVQEARLNSGKASGPQRSWLRNIGRFLRIKSSKGKSKQHSVPTSDNDNLLRASMTRPTAQRGQEDDTTSTQHSQGYLRYGLDGAADFEVNNNFAIDLNKPLPLNPEDIVKSMSSRSTNNSSSHYSQESTYAPLTPSTAPTSVSKMSTRADFESITQMLGSSTMFGQHELSPIQEKELVYFKKAEPQKSSFAPSSPKSYSSVSQSNPFVDEVSLQPSMYGLGPTLAGAQDGHSSDTQTCMRSLPTEGHTASVPRLHSQARITTGKTNSAKTSPVASQGLGIVLHPKDMERGRKMQASAPSASNTSQPETPTKRSRSPVKRLLRLTKSSSSNDVPAADSNPQADTPTASSKKHSIKKWGDRLRYGFLSPDEEQHRQETLLDEHIDESTPPSSRFPVSLNPHRQARTNSELELLVNLAVNRFLMIESQAGRISPESVAKVKEQWSSMGRPQVIEFHYDVQTQYHLVVANLSRVRVHGDASRDELILRSTLDGWRTMARELAITTFCTPDSVIRKHLHDAHRVLEFVGARQPTLWAFQDMQVKSLAEINWKQKERAERKASGGHSDWSTGRSSSESSLLRYHCQNFGDVKIDPTTPLPFTAENCNLLNQYWPSPSPKPQQKARRPQGDSGAMSLPSQKTRDGYRGGMH